MRAGAVVWYFVMNPDLILQNFRLRNAVVREELLGIRLVLQDFLVRDGLDLDCRAGRNRFDWLLRRVDRSPKPRFSGVDSTRYGSSDDFSSSELPELSSFPSRENATPVPKLAIPTDPIDFISNLRSIVDIRRSDGLPINTPEDSAIANIIQ